MLVFANSVPVTDSSEEVMLKKVLYIKYLVQFQGGQKQIKALLNSANKVNAMNPNYTWNLGLKIWKTSIIT